MRVVGEGMGEGVKKAFGFILIFVRGLPKKE